jgi:UDP-glucose 4-epimerase
VAYVARDVRDAALAEDLRNFGIQRVVHLASIVTQMPGMTREFMYSVDVEGTRNVVEACLAAGVSHLTVTSSGAAYGYHADNPVPLREDDALRGNREFAYSDHKRQVEEMLAEYRAARADLALLVLRVATILGADTANQITNLFEKPRVMGFRGSDSPFVFIWDEDLVEVILRGMEGAKAGIYNVVGDGAVPLPELARALGKPFTALPAWLVRGALSLLQPLGIVRYGPEQVDFLRYRTVLTNERLKAEFGYTPQKSSRETFDYWLEHARSRGQV